MYQEANQALQRAENIIEQTYMITGEIKLLPVALQSVHKAAELAWLETKDNKKPFFLHQMETQAFVILKTQIACFIFIYC